MRVQKRTKVTMLLMRPPSTKLTRDFGKTAAMPPTGVACGSKSTRKRKGGGEIAVTPDSSEREREGCSVVVL